MPATTERERVLLAVAEARMETGYEELNSEEIAARAGIEAETFTAMFPKVEAAAQAALEEALRLARECGS